MWTVEEVKEVDRKTRTLLIIYRAVYPQADVDRLYLKRNEGVRLFSVEDCVEMERHILFTGKQGEVGGGSRIES